MPTAAIHRHVSSCTIGVNKELGDGTKGSVIASSVQRSKKQQYESECLKTQLIFLADRSICTIRRFHLQLSPSHQLKIP